MEETAEKLSLEIEALKQQLKAVVRTTLELQSESRKKRKRKEKPDDGFECIGRPWENQECAGCEYCDKHYKITWEGKKQPICHSCKAAKVRFKKAKAKKNQDV